MKLVIRTSVLLAIGAGLASAALAESTVQDIAQLKGVHANRLLGFGLVVGLNGTGDGADSLPTMRALMALHQRYEQHVFGVDELEASDNVAIVTVEVTTPDQGWQAGERVDVVVSALSAQSLEGGQLLATPLQVAPLPADASPALARIWALAAGPITLPRAEIPTRGIIRGGAVLEGSHYHSFIDDQYLTLVIDEPQASFPMARMMARSLNQELGDPTIGGVYERGADGKLVVEDNLAVAVGPRTVRVKIPTYELAKPANFITRVLQTPIFVMPRQRARVIINKSTQQVTLTGTVTIRPAVVQIPGMGTVAVGQQSGSNMVGVATEDAGAIEFQQLLATLQALKLAPEQTVQVVEQLKRAGALNARVEYTE